MDFEAFVGHLVSLVIILDASNTAVNKTYRPSNSSVVYVPVINKIVLDF
jgi:hypothetical protein